MCCIECHGIFSNATQLNKHAKDTSHKSYGCTCGTKFSRLDALTRHINSKSNEIPKYPCERCDNHQGMNGFHRRDHLVQHMKVCRGNDVEDKLPEQKPNDLLIDMTFDPSMLMNEDAIPWVQTPPFPCTVMGCDKWGVDGYLREVDLIEHQNWVHPFMVQNQVHTASQFPGGVQFSQLNDPQLYQPHWSDNAPQFPGGIQPFQPNNDLQPFQQVNELQFHSLNNAPQSNGQDGTSQFYQQGGTSQFQF
ncbi:hypothetical protein F4781DRAFT_162552 [Annulohypoxylon bovei var. microspora]|nr:hypothetical protein F4781DRAFT_162552 [Annulohypoxylon bovei var. microspora]